MTSTQLSLRRFWTSAVHDNRRFIPSSSTRTAHDRVSGDVSERSASATQVTCSGWACVLLPEPDQPIRHPERRGHRRPGAEGQVPLIDARISIGRRSPNAELPSATPADQITVSDLDGRSVIQTTQTIPRRSCTSTRPYVHAGSQLYHNALRRARTIGPRRRRDRCCIQRTGS